MRRARPTVLLSELADAAQSCLPRKGGKSAARPRYSWQAQSRARRRPTALLVYASSGHDDSAALCSVMMSAVGRRRERRFGVDAHVPE